MSFLPFSEIIGQEKAIHFLKKVIAQEKIPHAYLFVGIPGIGKTTTALALGQAINCVAPSHGEGCGRCPSCRQFVGGKFLDLEIIVPDGQSIKIEQIRGIDRMLSFKTLSGAYRMVIIRQAEMMTQEAANAFLKTLEEPPQGNILILNAIEPMDLLPTIVSRCQKVVFRPIPTPLVAQWLMEKKMLGEEAASLLANIAEGSLGRALALGERGLLDKRHECISSLINLRDISKTEALELALRLTGKEKRRSQDEQEGEKREKAEKGEILFLLGVWKSWYRDLLLLKSKGGESYLVNTDFSPELKRASRVSTIEGLLSSFQALVQAERDFLSSRNLDLMMENLMLTLRGFMGGKE